MVSLLFGVKWFGFNLGLISIAPACGGMIYGVISGKLYEDKIKNESLYCYGADCWEYAFYITAASCYLGSILAAILLWRTRNLKR